MGHHSARIGGLNVIIRPLRAHGWTQWRAERRCRKTLGHCWHPEGLVDWWCCVCSAETAGMPVLQCRECKACDGEARDGG
jgi:hypothetical protein